MANHLSAATTALMRKRLRIAIACMVLAFNHGATEAAPATSVTASARAVDALPDPRADPAAGETQQRTRANFKGAAASTDVRLVADWLLRGNRHRGHPFIVADKMAGFIYAFDDTGSLLAKAPALFGAARGDVLTEEQADKTIAEMLPADMITPAGLFVSEFYLSPSYGKSVRFAGYANTNLLIHRAPGAKRLKQLQSQNTSGTRITLGCINALPEFMTRILIPHFSGESTVVILPEAQSARSFFAINDAADPAPARQNMAAARQQ